jgi:hypothetical protein
MICMYLHQSQNMCCTLPPPIQLSATTARSVEKKLNCSQKKLRSKTFFLCVNKNIILTFGRSAPYF